MGQVNDGQVSGVSFGPPIIKINWLLEELMNDIWRVEQFRWYILFIIGVAPPCWITLWLSDWWLKTSWSLQSMPESADTFPSLLFASLILTSHFSPFRIKARNITWVIYVWQWCKSSVVAFKKGFHTWSYCNVDLCCSRMKLTAGTIYSQNLVCMYQN